MDVDLAYYSQLRDLHTNAAFIKPMSRQSADDNITDESVYSRAATVYPLLL
jgi:hypothetical protein